MGGCAMIGQTMINIHNGSKLRMSGVVAAITLLIMVLYLDVVIAIIPLGGLVGIMAMVVIHTFEWKTFSLFLILPWFDSFIVIVVTALAVLTNLAYAVGAGIVLQALSFSWANSGRIKRTSRTLSVSADGEEAVVTYVVEGPLFFASVGPFKRIFSNLRGEPACVVLHLEDVRVFDSSGLVALNECAQRLRTLEKKAVIYLSPQARASIDPSAEVMTDITFVSKTARALKFPYALPEKYASTAAGLQKFRRGYCCAYSAAVKWMCTALCYFPLGIRQKCCYAAWRVLCCVPCWEKPLPATTAHMVFQAKTTAHTVWKALCWNLWIESSCGPPAEVDDEHPVIAFDTDTGFNGAEVAGSDIWDQGFKMRRNRAGYTFINPDDADEPIAPIAPKPVEGATKSGREE